MHKILIISFYFPPTGVGGAIRVSKFVKYFEEFGIEPIVITTTKNTYGTKDFSLLKDIPENIKVFRISSFYLPNLMPKFKILKINQIISFISRNFIWPDPAIHWSKKAFSKAKEIIRKENTKIILTTGGPFSTHLVGLLLKKNNPYIKWFADFRDEWTTNSFVKYGPIRKIYERNLEKNVFEHSDRIIAISSEMKKSFIKLYPNTKGKITVINNGYDEDDFKDYTNRKNIYNLTLKIAYTGSIYGLRNPENLFKVLNELVKKDKYKGKIQIDFIGHNSYFIMKGIKKYKLQNIVKIIPKIPHSDLFNYISDYDILLLILGVGEKSKKILTGKLFEYLRLYKPILALGPEHSEVAEILEKTKSGIIVEFTDTNKIKKILEELILSKEKGELYNKFEFNKEEICKYDRKYLTQILSELIIKETQNYESKH